MLKTIPQQPVLVNEDCTRRFREQGYFTLPLLDAESCMKLAEKLRDRPLVQDSQFRFSIKSDDIKYKKHILEILKGFFQNLLPSICPEYQLVRAVYLEKDSGADSAVALHADDCSCDESRFVPFHIWMPLVDTNRENGCLCMVNGSHLATNLIRGIQVPQHHSPYHQEILRKYLSPLEIPAGVAVIYHPALLHYSFPNLSGSLRPAVVAAFIPREATPLVYFQRNKWLDKSILEYEMSAEQYCSWDEKREPDTRLIRKVRNANSIDRSPEFIKTLENARP